MFTIKSYLSIFIQTRQTDSVDTLFAAVCGSDSSSCVCGVVSQQINTHIGGRWAVWWSTSLSLWVWLFSNGRLTTTAQRCSLLRDNHLCFCLFEGELFLVCFLSLLSILISTSFFSLSHTHLLNNHTTFTSHPY